MSQNFYPQNQVYFNNTTKSRRNQNESASSRKENVNQSLSRDINASRNDSQRGANQSTTQLLHKISFLQQELQKIMKVLAEDSRNNSGWQKLSQQNIQLKTQLQTLQSQRNTLQYKLIEEQEQRSILESQIQQLKQQNINEDKSRELESKIIKLNEEIQALLQKIQSISGQNDELKYLQSQLQDMEVLKEENFYLKKQIQNINEVTYREERKLKLELEALRKQSSYTERKAAQQELVSQLELIIQQKDEKICQLEKQNKSNGQLTLLNNRIKLLETQLQNCQRYIENQSQTNLQDNKYQNFNSGRDKKYGSPKKSQILHQQTISFGQIPFSTCRQHLNQISSLQRIVRDKDDLMQIMKVKNQQIIRQLKIENSYHKQNVKKLQEDLANMRINWRQPDRNSRLQFQTFIIYIKSSLSLTILYKLLI